MKVSLRYKLAIPVLVFTTLMLLFMFRATYHTVREIVLHNNERRLHTIAQIFAESVRIPLLLKNREILLADVEWMAKRPDILGVSVEDENGVVLGAASPSEMKIAADLLDPDFKGVHRVTQDTYAAVVWIREADHVLGKVILFFFQPGLEEKLRQIFLERLLVAFAVAILLAFLIAGITWVAILPLFKLKSTAQQILSGDLSARANIRSFDEIQDLSEAFNEMVTRLTRSFENLRLRTEALEESEEKYRHIVEGSNDIIFIFNADGEIILLNRGFSGCARDDILLGGIDTFLKLQDEESREQFQDMITQVLKHKEDILNFPMKHIHAGSQNEIYYLANISPVLGSDGNVKFFQVVLRDVTELKRIDMMKDSLIRDVAHELKTPTSKFEMAVDWFEKELKKQDEYDKYQEIITILVNNTDRLMRTITGILDLTKLESGMTQLVLSELDINDVLRLVQKDMKPICDEKGLSLKVQCHSKVLRMRGDKDMIYRLFVNLVANAVKFTDEGGITIKSSLSEEKILVSVRDTGIGVVEEDLEKIFDRFVQKTASSIGIGVGLTISKDIALLHQGTIWAESEGPGKGTVFNVRFPLLD